jgi:transcriptional regulator with XRE-family HTH domain
MPHALPTTNRVERLRFEAQVAEIAHRIGARIAELRKEKQLQDPKWTQDYLARQVDPDLTSSQVSRYERGEVKPHDDRLEKIAEVLGTDLGDLYAGPMSARRKTEAPDVLSALNGGGLNGRRDEALARIEEKLDEILNRLDGIEGNQIAGLAELVDRIGERVGEEVRSADHRANG